MVTTPVKSYKITIIKSLSCKCGKHIITFYFVVPILYYNESIQFTVKCCSTNFPLRVTSETLSVLRQLVGVFWSRFCKEVHCVCSLELIFRNLSIPTCCFKVLLFSYHRSPRRTRISRITRYRWRPWITRSTGTGWTKRTDWIRWCRW